MISEEKYPEREGKHLWYGGRKEFQEGKGGQMPNTSEKSRKRNTQKIAVILVQWTEEKPDGSGRDPAAFFSESWHWRKEGVWHLIANWHPYFPGRLEEDLESSLH